MSRSSKIQLKTSGKAGSLGRNKLDVGVRDAFKEVSTDRTLKTISSGERVRRLITSLGWEKSVFQYGFMCGGGFETFANVDEKACQAARGTTNHV